MELFDGDGRKISKKHVSPSNVYTTCLQCVPMRTTFIKRLIAYSTGKCKEKGNWNAFVLSYTQRNEHGHRWHSEKAAVLYFQSDTQSITSHLYALSLSEIPTQCACYSLSLPLSVHQIRSHVVCCSHTAHSCKRTEHLETYKRLAIKCKCSVSVQSPFRLVHEK